MTDKKLTDKEIIKALEEAIEYGCGHYVEIELSTIKDVLDLINRLQAQIDEMFDTLDYRAKKILELEDNLKTAKAENSNLEVKISEVEYDFSLLKQEREVVKAEAYKEFADKLINERLAVILLKNVSDEFAIGYKTALIDVEEKSNNLLKELVGE